MKPWCVSVDMAAIAVDSWPPPSVPVLMNRPAYLPQKEPWDWGQYRVVVSCVGKGAYLLPLLAGLVPEGLELGGEVAVAGGDAEEDGVEGLEFGRVVQHSVVGLGWSVHLLEDLVGERLRDLEEGGIRQPRGCP